MALRARKVSGAFEKRAPGDKAFSRTSGTHVCSRYVSIYCMELSMAAVVIYKHNILNLATTSMSPFEMQMFMIILGIITNKHLYFLK